MLATLTAVTLLLFRDILNLGHRPHTEPSMLVLAAACGLFIAPFLTLVCRSTLAAVVFTIAIPGLLAVGADIAGGLLYGIDNAAAIDRFKLAVFWRGMFLHLRGGRGRRLVDVHASRGRSRATRTSRFRHSSSANRLRARARAGGTIPSRRSFERTCGCSRWRSSSLASTWLSWVAFGVVRTAGRSDEPTRLLIPLTLLYGGSLAMLIGSLASAEERQLGTLEWQTLLPSPAWQQWAVKVGVTFGLALLLGVGLPALLHGLDGAKDYPGLRMWRRSRRRPSSC